MSKDTCYIKETLSLARKAQGNTFPNPLVGAIIVKNSKVIAKGYHKKAGLAHAEIEAINSAKESIKGATLYLNLEPCYHRGRTGPCVDEVIAAGIKKVVIATKDPNPLVNGKSIAKLKKAAIEVRLGICEKEARKLNEVFFTNMEKNRPFVVAKIAQSLDGKIATSKGQSKWITSTKTRRFSKSLRDKYDSILVGSNTIIKDNPKLEGLNKILYKVVISPRLNLSPKFNIFRNNPEKVIIFTALENKNKVKVFPREVNFIFLKKTTEGLSIKKILRSLYKRGVTSVFIEGGSDTLGRFFKKKLIDKIYFFIAPKIIGGRKALGSISGEGFPSPNNCPKIRGLNIKNLGKEILIWGYPDYSK